MRYFVLSIFFAVILIISSGIYFFFNLKNYSDKPLDYNKTEKTIHILQGQGLGAVSQSLTDAGIITDPFKFKLIARFKGLDKQIKAGEYLLDSSMPPLEILKIINKGKVVLYRLTIPEGYSMEQIAELVETSGFGDQKAFMQLAADPVFVSAKGFEGKTLEGYLFPDTYYFSKNTSLESIITAMTSYFKSVFTSKWEERADELGMSIHQIVTLASIIEKETGAAHERPVISSVFHNRLKKNMRLQSDPTVIYNIKDFDGNLTKKNLQKITPYNTYKIKGLPPGPIANPGKKSLEAALWPADTKYLYFVSKGDKTHEFSTNLKDHNKAVRKYQLSR
ncbi:Endolytic murein transglycosylase [Desulfonema limicola]|uniref:Endolytic murein transglycosylase n=1 Tax=Desulfonema limicola TaxID=45656 RepID=A0A975B5K5_9BACT|nr:endolytic transglycosylase MltG [Desulfonema limicola]QTA79164.1 Endolytic murein transglycosylase [Desulfonema limicola]